MAPPSSTPRSGTAFVLVAGCAIALVAFGVRSIYGLFVEPLAQERGFPYETIALAIALQNLIWGAAQPLAGAVADRFGPARVLAAGGLVYAAGVALTGYATTPALLHLSAGLLVGLGLAGASFAIVIAAFSRILHPAQRSRATGAVTAAGSLGQFVFAPIGQGLVQGFGFETALYLLALCTALVPVLAVPLAGAGQVKTTPVAGSLRLPGALRVAFGHRSYVLLVSGFFVCGFHVAFITAHLPAHLANIGVAPWIAAWSLGLIGLFNIVGAWTSGELGGRFSRRWLLTAIYTARAVVIAAFVLLPPTDTVVLGFAAAMGLLWFSTVPPTSGLVGVMFGTRYLGTLFGIVFFGHQVGAFAGVALALLAAALHVPIAERPAPRFAAEAAA